MIKKIFGIITFFALCLFLIMPVHAQENIFTKQTGVYTTDLDYRNSLIDWNGFNIEFNIFWDKRGGASPSNPRVYVFDESDNILFTLTNFIYDDETEMFKLSMTTTQENIIKATLFDRTTEQANRRIYIDFTRIHTQFIFFEIRLRFKSLLNINFGSVYTDDNWSGDAIILPDSDFSKVITFYKDDLAITGILLDDETTQIYSNRQRALYNFSNTITNIDAIFLSYTLSKPTSVNPQNLGVTLREIGLFASSQVVLPDLDIDTDFQIYEPTICGLLDLACVSRNLIGELSNTVYNRLGADSIASSVLDIYDALFYPVYIIENTAWQNAILAIYIMLPIGIIVMLVKRVT